MSDPTSRAPISTNPRFADQSGPIDPADHLGLIWRACKNAKIRYGGEAEDYFGLFAHTVCRAADKFDPSRGFRFSTYAMRAIGNDMTLVPSLLKYGRRSRVRNRPHEYTSLAPEMDSGDAFGATTDPLTTEERDFVDRLLDVAWVDEDAAAFVRLVANGNRRIDAAAALGKSDSYAKATMPDLYRALAERAKRLSVPPDEREGQDSGGRERREAERERYRGRPLEGGGRRGFCGSCGVPMVCKTLEQAWSGKTRCGECEDKEAVL